MDFNLTEEQWTAWDGPPDRLIDFVNNKVSQRKIRLFYCACVRRILPLLKDNRSRTAVEASELFADGCIDSSHLLEARKKGYSAWYDIATQSPESAEDHAAAAAFMTANDDLVYASGVPSRVAATTLDERAEYKAQVACLRDIVGNPFRPPSVNLAILTPTIVSLAQAAYEKRSIPEGTLSKAQLAVLADALEEAGYTDNYILSHCRGEGMHMRGCWVVDLILGKN